MSQPIGCAHNIDPNLLRINQKAVIVAIMGIALLTLGALAVAGFFEHPFLGTTSPSVLKPVATLSLIAGVALCAWGISHRRITPRQLIQEAIDEALKQIPEKYDSSLKAFYLISDQSSYLTLRSRDNTPLKRGDVFLIHYKDACELVVYSKNGLFLSSINHYNTQITLDFTNTLDIELTKKSKNYLGFFNNFLLKPMRLHNTIPHVLYEGLSFPHSLEPGTFVTKLSIEDESNYLNISYLVCFKDESTLIYSTFPRPCNLSFSQNTQKICWADIQNQIENIFPYQSPDISNSKRFHHDPYLQWDTELNLLSMKSNEDDEIDHPI